VDLETKERQIRETELVGRKAVELGTEDGKIRDPELVGQKVVDPEMVDQ
jgi:hypothetical protein